MKGNIWRTVAIAIAIVASGCATPDFKPFATETADLGGAISAEQTEVVARFAQTGGKAETRNRDDPRAATLAKQKKAYADNAAAVNAVMDVAVDYSNVLVDLAAAGESGAKAVNSLADTLRGFSSALNIAFPLADAPVWASKLASEIAQDVTRVQAQNSLAEATTVADPTIRKMADAITNLHEWPKGAQARIVAGLQSSEEGILRDIVGQNRIALFTGISVDEVQVADLKKQSRLEYFFGEIDDRIARQSPVAGICGIAAWEPAVDAQGKVIKDKNGKVVFVQHDHPGDDRNCLTGQTAQGLQAIVNLLSGIEPQYQAYIRDLATSRKWLEERQASSGRIADAAKIWAVEHSKLAKQLEECGGLRALRKSCGNLTFSNFKLAVARVKSIAGKGGQ